jgi:molybdenum cofactor cytidylyltransferase
MGAMGPKLLLPFRGRPLIAHVVDAALASRLAEVVVVLGPEPERFREAIAAAGVGGDARVRTVVNARFAEGRSGSIRTGLEALDGAAPGALFLLGDQPLMTAALIDAVIARAEREDALGEAGAPLVVPIIRDAASAEEAGASRGAGEAAPGSRGAGEAKGNPVLFRRSLFESLSNLTGDRGALALIESMWARAARVPVDDPSTQRRIETPGDYAMLLARADREGPA